MRVACLGAVFVLLALCEAFPHHHHHKRRHHRDYSSSSSQWQHHPPPRSRFLHAQDGDVASKAEHVFRAMDANHDHYLDKEDVEMRRAAKDTTRLLMHVLNGGEGYETGDTGEVLHQPKPAAQPEAAPEEMEGELSSFLAVSDENGDGRVSRDEFMRGLGDLRGKQLQLEENPSDEADSSPLFVETRSRLQERRFLGKVGKAVGKAVKFVRKLFGKKKTKAPKKQPKKQESSKKESGIEATEDGCVICQYVVEKMESNVLKTGIMMELERKYSKLGAEQMGVHMSPGMDSPAPGVLSLLEVEAEHRQIPLEARREGVLTAERQPTRWKREMERQKYNEIYRVVDITLDDVCEQAMPNNFYRYCQDIYEMQADIVDGLRYRYEPTDICFKVGICAKGSYITKGLHSRYKHMRQGPEPEEGSEESSKQA